MARQLLHQRFLPSRKYTPVQAFVWKYSNEYGGQRPRHFHLEPELNLVVSGWAEFGVGERVVRVETGELIGFPAGQDHVLLRTSPDVYLYALGMAPRMAAEVLGGRAGESAVPLHLRLDAESLALLTRQAGAAVERVGAEQVCSEIWEQVHWLDRRGQHGGRGRPSVLTTRALEIVADAPELSLTDVARLCRGNPSEVSRHFHRDLGMTLVRYRTRLRLLRFLDLVDEGRGTWTSAASAAGFGSYSQCHRTFQAELGCSPRDYHRPELRRAMQDAYEDGSEPQPL